MTELASIRPDVHKRLIIVAALTVFAAACSAPPKATIDYGSGVRFVPVVADALDDVGLGSAVGVASDGSPYISYFGFPAVVAEGEIAPARPIGAPFLPGVLLATDSTDGMWTRGAVQQTKPAVAPVGIGVPFGPDTVEGLDLTPANAAGTAVVVGADGTVHVAWTAGAGVYYASTMLGGTSTVSQLFDFGTALTQAGPIGSPGIALDDAGNPWVAYAVNGADGIDIQVATPATKGWDTQTAAVAKHCNGCAQPGPTGIGVVGGAPLVVYMDAQGKAVRSASLDGSTWTVADVETGVQASGLSLAASGDAAYASYYTGAGAVDVAVWDGTGWTPGEAASVTDPGPANGVMAATTGVAVDDQGTTYVAWEDAGVHLASGTGGTYVPVAIQGAGTGARPSLAVSGGNVFLAWYDTAEQNLLLGAMGDFQDILIANPSPVPTVSIAPPVTAECGKDGKIALDIVAKAVAFDTNCLVAPAGQAFEITLDNQDAAVGHNVAIWTKSPAEGGTALFTGEVFPGVAKQTYKVPALDPGTYYFQCDVHPTTMFGTFVVVDSKAK